MYDIYVCQAWIFDIQEEDLNNQTNHSYTLDFLESPECNYDLSDSGIGWLVDENLSDEFIYISYIYI